ncbi:MAG TPA: precorrin-6Y C5,15-methyltransferase (decarboxylating) subunit CbiT [Ktedonobacteraceae bacterium]|jgi:precorrin-6Y C5,15-methyltransferase (decarboxylating)
MSDKRASQIFGLPDELFTPRRPGSNVITKRDVRAITLAHLGLHQHTILWDIGSGTGSVAIEAAHLASAGHVYAIECNTEALEAIKANCYRLQASNVSVVAGRAPQVLHDLPDPDAVFIGGSGGELTAILEVVMARLRPSGHLVVNLATFEHLSEAVDYLRRADWVWECTMVNIAHTQKILDMTRFAAMNPVFVLTASQKGGKQ